MEVIDSQTSIQDLIDQELLDIDQDTLGILKENWINCAYDVLNLIHTGKLKQLGIKNEGQLELQFQKFLFPSPDIQKYASLLTYYTAMYDIRNRQGPFIKQGIIHSLGTKFNTKAFVNPVETRDIRMSCNRSVDIPIRNIVTDNDSTIIIIDSSDTRIKLNFNGYKAKVTEFACTIDPNIGMLPVMFELFGSNNDISWVKLFSTQPMKSNTNVPVIRSTLLNRNQALFTIKDILCPPKFFTYFMLVMPQSYNNSIVGISQFEMYGCIAKDPIANYTLERKYECAYQNDLDTNGLISYIGKTSVGFRNPVILGKVGVESSALYQESPPALALLNRELVPFSTDFTSDAYVSFDFSPYYIRINNYTLVHYTSYDKEAVRYWEFQAFDETAGIWKVLKKHDNDKSLKHRGASKTWQITTSLFASKFRILMTGPNSNKNWYLCLGMIEFYGLVKYPEEFSIDYNRIPNRTKINSPLDLRYLQYIQILNNSLDNNRGILYFIGTEGLQNYFTDYRTNSEIEYQDSFGKLEYKDTPKTTKTNISLKDNKKPKKEKDKNKTDAVKKKPEHDPNPDKLDHLFDDLFVEKPSKTDSVPPIEDGEETIVEENSIDDDKKKYVHYNVEVKEGPKKGVISIKFKNILIKPSGYTISYYQIDAFKSIPHFKLFGIFGNKKWLLSEQSSPDSFNEENPTLEFQTSNEGLFCNEILLKLDCLYTKEELRTISNMFDLYGIIVDYKGVYNYARTQNPGERMKSMVRRSTGSTGMGSGNQNTAIGGVLLDSQPLDSVNILSQYDAKALQNDHFVTIFSSKADEFSGMPYEGFINSTETLVTLKEGAEVVLGCDIKGFFFNIFSYSLIVSELAFMFGAPKCWSIEISMDGNNWQELDNKMLANNLQDSSENRFDVQINHTFIDKLRIKQKGVNSIGKTGFSLNCISLFGAILKPHSILTWKPESKIKLEKNNTKADVRLLKVEKDSIESSDFVLNDIIDHEFGVLISNKSLINDAQFEFLSLSLCEANTEDNHSPLFKIDKVLVKSQSKTKKFECFTSNKNVVFITIQKDKILIDNNENVLALENDFKGELKKNYKLVLKFKGGMAIAGLVMK
eukprot:GAHX01000981.1.p1 GENE.GAHX01000981.1~~GAHX01000981.1.p1  ORF type:complete len:1095 (-),score=208.74 GAHX01000981.1:1507-4791(-)